MDRMFLDANALRLIAVDLIARRPVQPEQLAALGTDYVRLDALVKALQSGPGKSGRKPAAPTTDDGRLVERARVQLSKVWGRECSIADVARHIKVARSMLSRCNGKTPTALPALVRAHVLLIAEEGERRECPASG